MGREGRSARLVELLGERAVGLRIGCDDVDVVVGVRLDGVVERRVGGAARRVRPRRHGGKKILEEGKGGRGDGDGALLIPHVQGVIQLLGRREGVEVPGVSVVVDVFRIPSNGDCFTLGDSAVDGVDRTERVGNGLVIRQGLVAAGLESVGVTPGLRVEGVNRAEDRVRILSVPVSASVDFWGGIVRF